MTQGGCLFLGTKLESCSSRMLTPKLLASNLLARHGNRLSHNEMHDLNDVGNNLAILT
jgi:hypothetical protein